MGPKNRKTAVLTCGYVSGMHALYMHAHFLDDHTAPNKAANKNTTSHTTCMKIRGSVVSLSFFFPHPPEDKK